MVPNRNVEGSMNLIEPQKDNHVIQENVMSVELFNRLQHNMISTNDIQNLQTDPYQLNK